MTDDQQLQLPGIDNPSEAGATPMLHAARDSLRELRDLGQLQPRHAVQAQLVLSLAQAIDAGTKSGRASAVAMAAAQLRETMLVLDPLPEGGEPDARRKLDELVAALQARALERGGVVVEGRVLG